MGQVVYVDLFFMINFSMDFLCFFLASQLLSSKLGLLRSLIASIFGGIYACVALFLPFGNIGAVISDICVCILMCLIAFGTKGSLLGHTCLYFAVSAVLGGFMTALFELLNRADLPLYSVSGDGISAYLLALLALISALISLAGGRFFRRRTSKKYTRVHIEFEGKTRVLTAFCDSGNLLRDPIGGKACIVTDIDAVEGFFPEELIQMSRCGCIDTTVSDASLARRIRVIPTQSATGGGMLVAIRPDKISIGEGNEEHTSDALLALCVLGTAAEGCQALVPTSIL